MIELVHSYGYFRELSCRFHVGRVMFDILKRVTLMCIRALSEIFSLFLGVDVSDNWRVWISAVRVMTCVIYQ